jgi:hypothetical protein
MTAGAGTRAHEPPRQSLRARIARRLEPWWAKVVATLGLLGTLLGLVEGSIALYDHFNPPRPHAEAVLAVEHDTTGNVRFGRFRTEHPEFAGDRTFSRGQLATNGVAVNVDVQLRGLAHESVQLRWTLYDPGRHVPFTLPSWIPLSQTIRATSDDEPQTVVVWVPYPPGPSGSGSSFRVRFDPRSAKNAELGRPALSDAITFFNP